MYGKFEIWARFQSYNESVWELDQCGSPPTKVQLWTVQTFETFESCHQPWFTIPPLCTETITTSPIKSKHLKACLGPASVTVLHHVSRNGGKRFLPFLDTFGS